MESICAYLGSPEASLGPSWGPRGCQEALGSVFGGFWDPFGAHVGTILGQLFEDLGILFQLAFSKAPRHAFCTIWGPFLGPFLDDFWYFF